MGSIINPSRTDEENILIGAIGCQADKTLDAVNAFMGLLENMPINETRWNSAQSSILSNYRTNPVPYRSTPGFIYDTYKLGLKTDPRKSRFENVEKAKLSILEEFYNSTIKPNAKLLSIVGDSSKIDINELEKIGPVTRVQADQLFTR